MDSKILLINPPFKYQYSPHIMPLGIFKLGTILKNDGFDLSIIDINAEKQYWFTDHPRELSPEEFIKKFKRIDPDIVGITSCTENYPIALKIAELCKRENENVKIMMGGSHVSFQARECLDSNHFVDLIAIGEIEHVIIEIVKSLLGKMALEEINNIVYRENKIIKHSQNNYVPDLAKIPPIDTDLLKGKHYPTNLVHLEFTRGCRYKCAFCSLSKFSKNNVRFFPIKNIMDNLHSYKELFDDFSFFITDPTFLLNKKRVQSFLNIVKKEKFSLPSWSFQTKVNLINAEILKELKKSNVKRITLGIEDINDQVLKNTGKDQNFNQISNAIKILKQLDYIIHSNFIIGLPAQTKEHVLADIKFTKNLDFFNFSFLKPFPGSDIYNTPSNYGLSILTKNWELYTIYEIVMQSKVFPLDQQNSIRDLAIRHYAQTYLSRGIFHFVERKEYEQLLESNFDEWYENWKKNHATSWS